MKDLRTNRERDPVDIVVGNRRVVGVMGTVFTLDLRDLDASGTAVTEVVDWWRWVDATFSTYRSDSQISRLAAGSLSRAECAPEVRHVLDLCAAARNDSGGYFTDHPDGRLDPSGMVKGWSVETGSQMLRRSGSQHHCVTAGGDVRCTGQPGPGETWRIGVLNPRNPSHLAAVVSGPRGSGRHLAVATSGTAERGRHINNPLTGRPADELAAITVVGTNLTTVDWVATAAFAMGEAAHSWLAGQPDLEWCTTSPTGATRYSAAFQEWATTTSGHSGQLAASRTPLER